MVTKDKKNTAMPDEEAKLLGNLNKFKTFTELSPEVLETAKKVYDLIETLRAYNSYKNYDKNLAKAKKQLIKTKSVYEKFSTDKKFEKYFAAILNCSKIIDEHNNIDIEAVETKLKNYEGFIDKKYWRDNTLFFIFFKLRSGVVDSLEETIAIVDRWDKNKSSNINKNLRFFV